MTPPFALDLALEGIRLLYRTDSGWTVVGDASLNDPNIGERMARLRVEAKAITDDDFTTELILPPSQILYASLPHAEGDILTEAEIRPRLKGLTACPLDEIVFDWEVDEETLRLAIADRTTLDEAEDFAAAHGFNPTRFTARPPSSDFPRDPDFGPTANAESFHEAAPADLPSAGEAPDEPKPQEHDSDLPLTALAAPQIPQSDPDGTEKPSPESDAPLPRRPVSVRSPATPRPTYYSRPETSAAKELAASLTARRSTMTRPAAMRRVVPTRPVRTTAASRRSAGTRRLRRVVAAAVVLGAMGLGSFLLFRGGDPDPLSILLDDTPPVIASVPTDLAPPAAEGTTPDPRPAPVDAARIPATPDQLDAAAAPDAVEPAPTDPPEVNENPRLRYAATGIWTQGPKQTLSPEGAGGAELYVTSIDPVTLSRDAIALVPPASLLSQSRPSVPLPPPPAGTIFDLDTAGLVRATPDGAMTPDGVVVYLGRPEISPPARPRIASEDVAETEIFADIGLPDTRPRRRPGGLVERSERVNLGGRTRTELAGLQPKARPLSAQVEGARLASADPTERAVAASLQPRDRPANLAARVATDRAVAAALAASAPATEPATDEDDGEPEAPAARAPQPDIPTSASVARQATMEDAIRLRSLNLIGVYGAEGDRRALVRLPSGRYVKVRVGDRLDGGQIAAIGQNELRYVKGGRNITLKIPSG